MRSKNHFVSKFIFKTRKKRNFSNFSFAVHRMCGAEVEGNFSPIENEEWFVVVKELIQNPNSETK
jgi:hypothetical protein